MNLSEIRDAVLRRSGVAYDSTALDDLVNEALAKITVAADWPWLWDTYEFSATADVGDEVLPAGLRRIDKVTIDGYEAYLTSHTEIDAWDNTYSTSRRGYSVLGDRFYFRPTQSAGVTVTIRYLAGEDRLEDDTDEPYLPEQYHDALIDFAAGLALERAGNLARARLLTDRFDQWVRDMRRTALSMSGRSGRIRVRPGGGI